MQRYESVDDYIDAAEQWGDELRHLRKILLATKLEETVKWGAPLYTHKGKNVVGIGGFKSYVGLWFYQGALLSDPQGVLINAQEGKTKALRQWRFQNKREIKSRTIKAYVQEAILLQEQGEEIKPTRKKSLDLPPELEQALAADRAARKQFDAMTPGKRREYAEYIRDAKRADTKQKRLAKILPMITAGQGLNDKYRNC